MRIATMILAAAVLVATPSPRAQADFLADDGIREQRAAIDIPAATATPDHEVRPLPAPTCNVSRTEKHRRLHRSPPQAVSEDKRNVALIRLFAAKHEVPFALALSVAHAESGISTCSGSPTGVKGVMQLTKRTGRRMGFDRDINEQNIEGGIKYLGMGVKRCGSTNYRCLAAWYNGSTRPQRAQWARKVSRNRAWFDGYAARYHVEQFATPILAVQTTARPVTVRSRVASR